MRRREVLIGAAAMAALPHHAALAAPGVAGAQTAQDYAYPLWEFARAFARGSAPRAGGAALVNTVAHRATLSDHTSRQVTAPNNDTLYSTAYLELSGGPVEVAVPTETRRYFNIAFMNAFTDNFRLIGPAEAGRRFWIVGPGWRGAAPADVLVARSDTNDVWMLGRTLVDGTDDLAAANAVQQQMLVSAPAARGPVRPLEVRCQNGFDPDELLRVANTMLRRSQPARGQPRRARRFAAWGVGSRHEDAFARLSAERQAAWREAAAAAPARYAQLFQNGSGLKNGWMTPAAELGDFGENDTLRAAVALGGLAALPRREAMYFSSVQDSAGAPLAAGGRYRLHAPADVPVDAFWSITIYQIEADGRFFFVDNPIRRYSIGDRTRGVARNADGSIDIALQHEAPTDPKAATNWLPLPAGRWRASFRAYRPRAEMQAGRWAPPPLERA